jgi:hypothetical protein
MNVIPMLDKVFRIADSMIGESSLPNFPASELPSEGVRITPVDELNGSFQCDSADGR